MSSSTRCGSYCDQLRAVLYCLIHAGFFYVFFMGVTCSPLLSAGCVISLFVHSYSLCCSSHNLQLGRYIVRHHRIQPSAYLDPKCILGDDAFCRKAESSEFFPNAPCTCLMDGAPCAM